VVQQQGGLLVFFFCYGDKGKRILIGSNYPLFLLGRKGESYAKHIQKKAAGKLEKTRNLPLGDRTHFEEPKR
jgi:hypothetical protein